ncbi:MAG: acetyl-CoA carboxylase, biotin carboxyl carrier protein, partial [Helicobacter sp.]|nr:acetyl-CoA carboxylase, biotin carboxyl carrier protein [Helicobacter sp.]
MNLQEIKKLMEIFGNSQIAKLNLKDGEFELKLEKYTSVAPVSVPQAPVVSPVVANEAPQALVSTPAPAAPQAQGGEFITSPMVGTFY